MSHTDARGLVLLPLLLAVGCSPGGSPGADLTKGVLPPEGVPMALPPFEFYYTQPVVDGLGVVEPMAAISSEDDPTYLINIDVKFTNTSSQITSLSGVQVSYGGAGAPSGMSMAGPELVDAEAGHGVLVWGGTTWKDAGAGWEDPSEDGTGYWYGVVADGEETLAAGVSFLEPGGDLFVGRFDKNGALEARRRGFASASSSIATDLDLHGGAVYVLGKGMYSGAPSFVITKLDATTLEPMSDFGNPLRNGGRSGERNFTLPGCQLVSAEAIEVFSSVGGVEEGGQPPGGDFAVEQTWIYIGAEATCSGQKELIVARLTAAGDLDTSYGQGGVVQLDFPWAGYPTTFGGMGVQDIDGGSLVLAGNVGDRCLYTQTVTTGWCQPVITRYDWAGDRDLSFGGGGWTLPPMNGAQRMALEAAQIDGAGHVYLGGFAGFLQSNVFKQAWMLMRLTADGLLDTNWGAADTDGDVGDDLCQLDCYQGRVIIYPGDRTGSILDLALDGSDHPRAGGFVRRQSGPWDFAAARYNGQGTPQWTATAFAHLDPDATSATAYGIAVDSAGRSVLVGSAPGVKLGSARIETDGLLDSQLIVRPGESRGLRFPDGRHLPSAPASFTLTLQDGFGQMNSVLNHALAVRQPPSGQGYFFAIDPADLEPNEYVYISQHHELGDAHRGDDGQRFAYDLHVVRFNPDTGDFSTRVQGTDGTQNDDYLIWERPLRAVADGLILECYRAQEDNPAPGERNDVGGGGNMLWVLNDNGETMLYAHLRQDTMPEHLCPVEGEQAIPLPIVAGEPIGLAGNSGRSGGPHFHTHVQMGHDRLMPGTQNTGLPLLLRDMSVMDLGHDPDDDLWAVVDDQALPPGIFARLDD